MFQTAESRFRSGLALATASPSRSGNSAAQSAPVGSYFGAGFASEPPCLTPPEWLCPAAWPSAPPVEVPTRGASYSGGGRPAGTRLGAVEHARNATRQQATQAPCNAFIRQPRAAGLELARGVRRELPPPARRWVGSTPPAPRPLAPEEGRALPPWGPSDPRWRHLRPEHSWVQRRFPGARVPGLDRGSPACSRS